jgi:hypothetical protein
MGSWSSSASAIAEWKPTGDVEAYLRLSWGDTSAQLPAGLRHLHVYHGLRCLSALPALHDLRTLSLENCPIRALPCMPTLTTLRLEYCTNLRELSSLPALKILHVQSSYDMRRLPYLPKLQKLTLIHCWALRELPPLPNLQALQLHHCRNMRRLPDLPKLQELDIFGCENLRELPPFPVLRNLRICSPALSASEYTTAWPCEHCGVPVRERWNLYAPFAHCHHLRFAELPAVMPPELRPCTDASQWRKLVRLQHEANRRRVAASLPPAAMLYV